MRAEALFINGRAQAGRSRPPLCTVSLNGGGRAEVYLKATALHDKMMPRMLAAEWMGSRLAATLGMLTPQCFIVHMSPEFIEGVQDSVLRAQLLASAPLAFGSRALGEGWRPWDIRSRIDAEFVPSAMEVYVFDTLIGNSDRQRYNANLLVLRNRFALIDHEEAFFMKDTFTNGVHPPWETDGVGNAFQGDLQHALVSQFARRKDLSLEDPFAKWGALTAEMAKAFAAEVPEEWDRPAAVGAAWYIEELLGHIGDAKRQVGEALQWLR